MKTYLSLVAAISLGFACPASAAQVVSLQGLVTVPTEVRNDGSSTMLCQAEIAHWFAMDLATIDPGSDARIDLRFNRETGVWAAINSVGEALPVERAWCGVKGRTYETRQMLRLDRKQPQPIRLNCRDNASRLDCRED